MISMGLQRVGHDWATELNWFQPGQWNHSVEKLVFSTNSGGTTGYQHVKEESLVPASYKN